MVSSFIMQKKETKDMEQCLIDNKVCAEGHRKCKECKLNDCKKVLQMIEDEERYENIALVEKLKRNLPEECRECTQLKIINLKRQKVYCPYRIKDRCVLKERR